MEEPLYKSLSVGALGFRLPLQKAVEMAKIGGFEGIEISVVEMEEILRSKRIDEVRRLAEENALRFAGWGLPVNFRGDSKAYRADLAKLPGYAEIAEEIGCNRVFTWLLPFSDELPFEENLQFHVERLRPIAEILEDRGCGFGLEFVGPKTSRMDHRYEFIYTMDGMLSLCDEIGTGNLGLLLDSWHWYTTYGTTDQVKKLKSEQVVYVHINDAPSGIPIEEQIDNVRCLPGETGVIDLVGFLRALREIGYDGPVTPEPFSRKLKEMSVVEAVKLTGRYLDRVWKEAGIS
jgi:sugar phosphate isomerase/epimerase